MARLCFRCASSGGIEIDQHLADVEDWFAARDYAIELVRSRIAAAPPQNWRKHRLHVENERGEELFVLPFWSTLCKPALSARLKAVLTRALS